MKQSYAALVASASLALSLGAVACGSNSDKPTGPIVRIESSRPETTTPTPTQSASSLASATASSSPSAQPSSSTTTGAEATAPTPSMSAGSDGPECENSADCAATPATPVCEPTSQACVECLTDEDCSDGTCSDNACVAAAGCTTNEDCAAPAPFCSDTAQCVACLVDEDCSAGTCTPSGTCQDPNACALMTADACATKTIPKLGGAQVLDGNGEDFCSVPGFELNFSNADAGNDSTIPNKAIVHLAWTPDAFAAFIDVTDPEIATKAELDKLWGGDSIELFLSPDSSALSGHFTGTQDGVQLVFAPPSGENPARAARLFWQNEGGSWNQKREELTSGFKAVATAGGYSLELQLPWSLFGASAAMSGQTIAFDMALSTANASTIGQGDDGRQGSAMLFVGPAREGISTCSEMQEPWCNSTTWCSPVLE